MPVSQESVSELPSVAQEYDIVLKMTEMKDPAEARQIMPSPLRCI